MKSLAKLNFYFETINNKGSKLVKLNPHKNLSTRN